MPGLDGKPQRFGHLPALWSDVGMLLHGRSGSALGGLLHGAEPFRTWDVGDRYLDGSSVTSRDVTARRAVAHRILVLHQQATTAGVLT